MKKLDYDFVFNVYLIGFSSSDKSVYLTKLVGDEDVYKNITGVFDGRKIVEIKQINLRFGILWAKRERG